MHLAGSSLLFGHHALVAYSKGCRRSVYLILRSKWACTAPAFR